MNLCVVSGIERIMQSTMKEKGELVIETQSKIAGVTILDITQDGVKMQINGNGQSKGKYNSNDMSTTTVVNKVDGTSTWESKGIQNTHDGDMLVLMGSGTGRPIGPTTQQWEGEMHIMTKSPKLAWMNNANFWIEGSGDMAKGESHAKIYQQM
jgi:hypothetical protein